MSRYLPAVFAFCLSPILAQDPAGLPSLFVVGDSTASNTAQGQLGWGTPFVNYFDAAKVNIQNRARAGRSSRTFQVEGSWDRVLAETKAGDFVLIQFGHNDGGPADTGRARGSLAGLGEESREVTLPDGKKEVIHTFGWYMRKYIADVKAKGATPVVLSLTVRNIWTDGKVERGSGNFGKWSEEIARAQGVAFIDVTRIVADEYEKRGEAKVQELFFGDHTHTSPIGADLNARLVVAGIRGLGNHPLAALLAAPQANNPSLQPVPATPLVADTKLPSLILIGDSTVRNGRGDGSNGQWGWGEPLADLFDTTRINVVNRALGGLSSRTYYTMGHWDRVLSMLKPGDFVVMQFGHNDNGPVNDNFRARGTIRGTGEETEEIDNILTGKHEVVHTFGWYLRRFIADARAHGATPIVCSLIPRKTWKDGKIARNSEDWGKWAAEVARSENAFFIDLNERIALQYDAMGREKVEAMFADANTHTTREGAERNAAVVVAGIKALREAKLTGYLSAKGRLVE